MTAINRKTFRYLRLRQLDATLSPFRSLPMRATPKTGWISEIRKSLGMTTAQLGSRLGLTKQRVGALERAEAEGKVTLTSLKRAAQGLGCELVYAVVPKESLETMVQNQALALAKTIVQRAAHSMMLERQGTSDQEISAQIKDLTEKLKSEWPSRLWDARPHES